MVTTVNKQASVTWSTEEPEHLQINAAITELVTHFSEGTEPYNPHDYRVALIMMQEIAQVVEEYAHENNDPACVNLAEWVQYNLKDRLGGLDNPA